MIKISGLWKNEGRNGKNYYSGWIGNLKFLVFRNEHKKQDREPDLTLCIDSIEDDRRGSQEHQQARQSQGTGQARDRGYHDQGKAQGDETIPF